MADDETILQQLNASITMCLSLYLFYLSQIAVGFSLNNIGPCPIIGA